MASSLEVGSVVNEANDVSPYLTLKDYELHVLGHREPLKFLSKTMALTDWVAVWIHFIDMSCQTLGLALQLRTQTSPIPAFPCSPKQNLQPASSGQLLPPKNHRRRWSFNITRRDYYQHGVKSPADTTSGELHSCTAGRWSKALEGEQPAPRNRYSHGLRNWTCSFYLVAKL